MYDTCFDIVSATIENYMVNKELKIDNEKYDILKEYCESIEKVFESSDILEYECGIDENNRIHVFVVFDMLSVKNPSPRYWDMVFRSSSVSFYYVDDESVKTEFVFPSVFIKQG